MACIRCTASNKYQAAGIGPVMEAVADAYAGGQCGLHMVHQGQNRHAVMFASTSILLVLPLSHDSQIMIPKMYAAVPCHCTAASERPYSWTTHHRNSTQQEYTPRRANCTEMRGNTCCKKYFASRTHLYCVGQAQAQYTQGN